MRGEPVQATLQERP